MSLDRKAMLVSLSISQWTARKFDRKVTAETNQRYAANVDAGRWTKALVAREAIAKIASKAGAIRLVFLKHTLAWTDEGSRVVTVEIYQKLMRRSCSLKRPMGTVWLTSSEMRRFLNSVK